ncbi:DUF4365 domain-containing protein [Actinomadura sp. 7K534]|nr:DUF4365 domain-containing protein [Actinomadura sp. 7K534]
MRLCGCPLLVKALPLHKFVTVSDPGSERLKLFCNGGVALGSDSIAILPPNGSRSRYGVAYVRSICSQAGLGFQETSPDEDVSAVDGYIRFDIANTNVQIKCSSGFRIAGRSASLSVEFSWRQQWSKSGVPVYLILVILDCEECEGWVLHKSDGTFHRAAAFWARVDRLGRDQTRVDIPKDQRLTIDTMQQWELELRQCFLPERGGLSA